MNKSCTFLIMAAGTGGHVFPALAVAQALTEKGHNVQWLGTPNGMEQSLLAKHSLRLHAISMQGFRGKSFIHKLFIPLLLFRSLLQVIKVIRQVKPNVVLGFGGYIAVPGGLAAKLMGKTLIIHEQNSVAGSANKLLAKIANDVLVAYPDVLPKSKFVGNPVRDSIRLLHKVDRKKEGSVKNILVMGGSLGAQAINELVPEVFIALSKSNAINIWHQTGKSKLESTQPLYGELIDQIKIEEFITDVEAAYQWADIIICRAGALTVSELTIVGLPAVFIPLPHAIDNHQYFNAKWLLDQKAASLIEQKDLNQEKLFNELSSLLKSDEKLNQYSKKLKSIAKLDATDSVVSICEAYCSGVQSHAA